LKLIHKKIISVGSGYFASLPFFFIELGPILDSIILCIFFIGFYYLCDKIFEKLEKKSDEK